MATTTGQDADDTPGGGRALSPRERRRTRTMREIQTEALRLFAGHGYEQTTIEQIADAADISPRTFFRYFPTKEDVVLWDEYDAVIPELIVQRPENEPVGETMRVITRQAIEGLYKHDPERLLARYRLLFGVAAVRARFLEFARSGVEQLNIALATRRGLEIDDLKLQLLALSIIDAAGTALDRWQRSDGEGDLLDLFDQATDALIEGIAEMRPGATRQR